MKRKKRFVESGPVRGQLVAGIPLDRLRSAVQPLIEDEGPTKTVFGRQPKETSKAFLLQQILEEIRGMRHESRQHQRNLLHVLQQAGNTVPRSTDLDTALQELWDKCDGPSEGVAYHKPTNFGGLNRFLNGPTADAEDTEDPIEVRDGVYHGTWDGWDGRTEEGSDAGLPEAVRTRRARVQPKRSVGEVRTPPTSEEV